MKRTLIILAFPLLLTACADGKITAAEGALSLCQTYNAALRTASRLNEAGELSVKAEAAVDKSIVITEPLCGGPAPKFDGSVLDVVTVQAGIEMVNAAIGE
jgi:hypothetical protein